MRTRDSSDRVLTTCSYVDLGPAQLIGIPGELLPRLGLELKAMLPGPGRVLIQSMTLAKMRRELAPARGGGDEHHGLGAITDIFSNED